MTKKDASAAKPNIALALLVMATKGTFAAIK
jgi:hypothetical protein